MLLLARRLRRHPKQIGSTQGRRRELSALAKLVYRLGFSRETAWPFWRTMLMVLVEHPRNFETAAHMMALYLHFRKQTRFAVGSIEQKLARLRADPGGYPDAERHAELLDKNAS